MNLKLEQLDLFQMKENVTNDSWEGFFFYKLWGHLHFQEYLALLEKKRSVDFFPNLEKKPYNNESWNIKSHICIIEKLKGIPQSNCAKVAARGEHTECIGTHVRMLIDWLPKQWD